MLDHDQTLHRLFALLRTGRAFGYDELTGELGCSRRHVRRLFEQLRAHGIPVEHRTDGGLRQFFVPEAHLPKVRTALELSEEEIYALTVAARAARPALETTPLSAPLESAVTRLVEAYSDGIYTFQPEDQSAHWHFDAPAHNVIDETIFSVIRAAIRDQRTVEIDYTNLSSEESTSRPVDPYVIALRGTSWLLVARCHRAGSPRNFSLSAIERAVPTEAFFHRPDDFDPELHFRDAFGAMIGGEVHTVRLEVAPDKVPAFRRKSYHPTQQIETEHADGRIIVSYEVAGLDEIAAFIRSWGPGVTVLAPSELADRLSEEARLVAAQYAPSAEASTAG